MSWASGKGRFWGASDPRYWFPLDIHRGSKKTLLVLDVGAPGAGRASHPITPSRSLQLLRDRVRPADHVIARPPRGLLAGLTAASVGLIYGYDLSSIAGALLFITEQFGLTTRQQELLTTMVVIGQIAGALGRRCARQCDRA